MSDSDTSKKSFKRKHQKDLYEEEESNESDEDKDEKVEEPTFGPAALGLHRVGTALPPKPPQAPAPLLNARGMPARIRKKNKLFFDDDHINDHRALGTSPKKTPKPSPVKTPVKNSRPLKKLKKRQSVIARIKKEPPSSSPSPTPTTSPHPKKVVPVLDDKEANQRIGLKLRNLLKLPKAHKWVIYEMFYSLIDRPLFFGPNDFQIRLEHCFPALKTRLLTRQEWRYIRSKFGKPRRFSVQFLKEERQELESNRQKIRLVQTRKTCNSKFAAELPNEIPLPLPVGTKVTARLRHPQNGLFIGTVDAVDSMASCYRVTFDRPSFGTQTIPDYEIVSDEFTETVPLSSLIVDLRPPKNILASPSPSKIRQALNKSDPLLGQDLYENQFKNPVLARDTVGKYPIKLLELIVRTKKTFSMKLTKIRRLGDMNDEAESMKARNVEEFPTDFQKRYANLILALEKINRDLINYLNNLQEYALELSKEPSVLASLTPSILKEKCREMAEETVDKNRVPEVTNKKILKLITDVATILLVASYISKEPNSSNVIRILEGCIEELRSRLGSDNIDSFKRNVQIHLHHIRLEQLAIRNREKF